jgi:hypothetical protein
MVRKYKYYVSGHYSSSCFYLKHRPVYISKHNVSETGFCLRLQGGTSSTNLAQLSRFYLKMETPVSETLCSEIQTGRCFR